MKRINLRLDVTKAERDLIRKAAALAGYRSMAEFCRSVVLEKAMSVAASVAAPPVSDDPPQHNAK